MFAPTGMILLLLLIHIPYIEMAIPDQEATILGYISEHLNLEECHELYLRLAIPPKDTEQPTSEKDPLPPGQWQDFSNKDQCKKSLSWWLEMQRDAVDWDRLARGLRQIGRPDVSRELKKSLNKNRRLEPKWSPEENQTKEAPRSAVLIEPKVPMRRTRYSIIETPQDTVRKEDDSCRLMASFLKLFPFSFHNLNLQQYVGPALRLLIAGLLTGVILWLISAYYIICWNLHQCLFAGRGTPVRQNMNLTVIWNYPSGENTTDSQEDTDSSEEDEEEDTENQA